MPRARIGDVIEVPLTRGLAYAHYVHRNAQFGNLLRVFGTVFEARPSTAVLEELVAGEPQFLAFFPLQAALNQEIVAVAGRVEPSAEAARLPLFRAGNANPKTRKVETWWLWDGEKEWPIGKLSPAQRDLPIQQIVTDVILVDRIESGWKHRDWPG
jgi:hypothetical protein